MLLDFTVEEEMINRVTFCFCLALQDYFCRLIDDDGFILATNADDTEAEV